MDSHARSIAKAVSYRILGSLTTASIVFFISGDLSVSLGAGVVDSALKTGLYFAHERVWNRVRFGRVRAPEYEI